MSADTITGRLSGIFARYVTLAVLSQLGFSLYVLADTFFIANGVGSGGLVALNLSLPVFSLVNGLGLMLGIGGASLFSTRRGEALARGTDCSDVCNAIFTRMLVVGLALGAVFLLCGALFSSRFAWLLGARGASLPLSAQYLGTIMCFAPAFICNNIVVAFVRNDGSPQLAMAAMLTGSFANIFLDYLFIYPLGMGLFGAAFATGIAPVLSLLVCAPHFLRGRSGVHFTRVPLPAHNMKPALSGGIAALITELSGGAVILVFNLVLLALAGDVAVAAYGIIANVSLVATCLFTGIGQGAQPILSLNYGAHQHGRVRRVLLLACVTALLGGAAVFAAGLLFPAQITAAFNRDGDPQLAAYTMQGIRLYFSAFVPMGLNVVLCAYFSALARGRAAFSVSILRGFAAMVPLCLLLSRLWGVTGVWLTIPATELVALALALFLLRREKKRAALTNP